MQPLHMGRKNKQFNLFSLIKSPLLPTRVCPMAINLSGLLGCFFCILLDGRSLRVQADQTWALKLLWPRLYALSYVITLTEGAPDKKAEQAIRCWEQKA
jgi:hypothetical protein